MNSDFVCWYLLFPHIGLLRKGIGSRPNQLLFRYFELAKTFKLNLNCYVGMCCFQQSFCDKPGGLPQVQAPGLLNLCVLGLMEAQPPQEELQSVRTDR